MREIGVLGYEATPLGLGMPGSILQNNEEQIWRFHEMQMGRELGDAPRVMATLGRVSHIPNRQGHGFPMDMLMTCGQSYSKTARQRSGETGK